MENLTYLQIYFIKIVKEAIIENLASCMETEDPKPAKGIGEAMKFIYK